MFILSEKLLGVQLSNINKIVITLFSSKSEIFNIYDTNFKLDENIIPLITSVFEISPIIYNYKLYKCIDTNIIIKKCQQIANINTFNNDINLQYKFPSFYYDIDIFNNNKYLNRINNIKSTLINTIVDDNDKHIIRMYNTNNIFNTLRETYIDDVLYNNRHTKLKSQNADNTNNTENITNKTYPIFDDFTQNILHETEYKAISWNFEWGNFEMLINLNSNNDINRENNCNYKDNVGNYGDNDDNSSFKGSNTNKNNGSINGINCSSNMKVIYQINIDIFEDNTFIQSRLTAINNIISKIYKIKSIYIDKR